MHARKAGRAAAGLLDHRMVLVEDLRVGEHGHDLRRQDRSVDLDLAVVFLVDFSGAGRGNKLGR